jgi:hypothetical protein
VLATHSSKTGDDLGVEPEHIPLQSPARFHRHVLEAVDVFDPEPLTVEMAEHDPAALRAEIDCDHRRH